MSAFGATSTAEVVEGIEGIDFMMLGLMGEHELINTFVDAYKRYGEIVEKNKQDRLSALEIKRDELIAVSRTMLENSAKLHRATFTAMQEMSSAENEMRSSDNALSQLNYRSRHSGLLTRVELAEQQHQIEQAKKRCNDAQFAFTTSTRNYNMALQMETESKAAAAKAESDARQVDATLRQMRGEKNVRGAGGFFIS